MTDANYILYTEHFKVIFEYPIARCRTLVTLYQQIDPTMSLEKMVELQTNISGYVQRAIEVIGNTPQAVIPTEYPTSYGGTPFTKGELVKEKF